ncbi:hypothetical protein, partial [Nocardia otitidiscaviarum]|uniref:hypothetical protein n=1 Tax=Nocardia otitidiscaviarum TaxID=1823 RepID=UPI001C4995F3
KTTGDLTLMAATGDIATAVADTNREYSFTIAAQDALKSEIWAVGLLQVTNGTQQCKSILAKGLWAMTHRPDSNPLPCTPTRRRLRRCRVRSRTARSPSTAGSARTTR